MRSALTLTTMRASGAAGILVVLLAGCGATAPQTSAPSPTSPQLATARATSLPTDSLTPSSSIAPTPTVQSTTTSLPSATSTPTAAATTSRTLPPDGLSIAAEDIGRHLDALVQIASEHGGIRASGTDGYDASADYVAEQLVEMGYTVEREPFHFTFFDETAPVELSVGDASWSGSEWLHSMIYAGSGDISGTLQAVQVTPNGTLTGTGGCDPAEWSSFTAGNIAVIESGPCFRHDQVMNAQNAGAAGLISLYPNSPANATRRPTLVFPGDVLIPAIVAGSEPSAAILAALAAGGTAHMNVQVEQTPASDDNIVAEWPGASTETVMLGGHLDSVLDGPGINDNGSGVATLLALAKAVSLSAQPQMSVRFGFWGAEEFGELGSSSYVSNLGASEQSRIKAYLNLDMVASPGAARFVYGDADAPPGSQALVQALLDALADSGKPGLTTDIGGSSDHFMFERVGIPSAGLFSGLNPLTPEEAAAFGGQTGAPADPCYHLACDARDNANLDSALTLGGAVAAVLEQLAY